MAAAVAQAERVGGRRRIIEPAVPSPPSAGRVASIDALRGFTILVMIFVNDLAGVAGVPGWMKHIEPPTADGMTFVDVVFPAFLFIVGMSIPFALERRFERGDSLGSTWLHILLRTFSLLVIGVYMVNTETMSDEGFLHPSLWTLLMYVGVICVWVAPPRSLELDRRIVAALRVGGAVLLAALAFLYRGEETSGVIEMRTHWWGILGLIGWAYLTACAAYLLFRRRVPALLGAMVLLYCVYVADATGFLSGAGWLSDLVDLGSLGSHGGLTVSGVILGVMLLPSSPLATHMSKMRWALLYGLGLAAAAHLLHSAADVHQMFIVNKILATPPWCLWSAAITIWIWVGIYWLLDVRGRRSWSKLLEKSGQNALLAYILAPIFYAVFALVAATMAAPNLYAQLGGAFVPGLVRSVLFAVAVVWIAAVLRRSEYLLKL